MAFLNTLSFDKFSLHSSCWKPEHRESKQVQEWHGKATASQRAVSSRVHVTWQSELFWLLPVALVVCYREQRLGHQQNVTTINGVADYQLQKQHVGKSTTTQNKMLMSKLNPI